MNFERIAARLRLRKPYEAIDLGFLLTRNAGRAVWLPWFAVTLPVFVLINAVCGFYETLWLAPLLLWWLKPLFDRIPLFVLSQHLFGATPGLRAALRALPGLWLKALPGALLWSRLDFARSFNLPVAQLEGLRGMARVRRQRLLQRNLRSPAVWLTVGCLHLEAFFALSAWVLLLMFVPVEYLPESAKAVWAMFVQNVTPAGQLTLNFMAYLAMSAIEPFYVGAGFALYINRRTELEGWDINVAFLKLAERMRRAGQSAAATLAGVIVCVLLSMPAVPAYAEEQAEESSPVVDFPAAHDQQMEDEFKSAIRTAYEDEFLSPVEEKGRWQLRPEDERPSFELPFKWPEWLRWPDWLKPSEETLAATGGLFAWVWEFGIWLLVLGLLLLVIRYRSILFGWTAAAVAKTQIPLSEIESDEVRRESLPEDIPAEAAKLWQQGRARDAIGLLYRGGVAGMQILTGEPVPEGATESVCLKFARKLPDVTQTKFRGIVRAWQFAAYAQQVPDDAGFERLLANWRSAFGAAA